MIQYYFYHYHYGLLENIDAINFSNNSVKYDSDWYSLEEDGKLLQIFPNFKAISIDTGEKVTLKEYDKVLIDDVSVAIIHNYEEMDETTFRLLKNAKKIEVITNTVISKQK